MIAPPSGVRVWLATGATDMRRGMNGLALQVQEALHRDPHAGDLYVFRGKRGNLVKVLWHDGLVLSPSPPHSSATCWRASTGGIRNGHGDRRWPAEVMFSAVLDRFIVHGNGRV